MLTVGIALIAVCLTFAQWHTANQKVKVDILEKRYELYKDLENLINEALIGNSINNAAKFVEISRKMRFLFPVKVVKALEEISEDFVKIEQHYFQKEDAYADDYTPEFIDMKKETRKKFDDLKELIVEESKVNLWTVENMLMLFKVRRPR